MSNAYINRCWNQLMVLFTLCLLVLHTTSTGALRLYSPYDDLEDESTAVKRDWPEEGACQRCFTLYSSEDCERCFALEPEKIPFFATKRAYGSYKRGSGACFCCQYFRSSTHLCCKTCYRLQHASQWSK